MKKMAKKGQIQTLQNLVGPLIGVAIALTVGFLIFSEVTTQVVSLDSGGRPCTNDTSGAASNQTAACNGTRDVVAALEDIPGWLSIIVVAVIGAALLGLVAFFRNAGGR